MQTLSRIGRRVSKAAAVALASALAIGGVKRARQEPRPDFVVPTPNQSSAGGGARGFVATVEDRSNDRGFVASVEDKSNDHGFVASVEDKSNDHGFVAGVRNTSNNAGTAPAGPAADREADPTPVPEADPPVPPPADLSTPAEQAPAHETPHELGDPPKDS